MVQSEVKDFYKEKEKYFNWKARIEAHNGIEGLTSQNSDFIIKYIFDMEHGANVSKQTKKGPRSYKHLTDTIQRLTWLFTKYQERGVKDIRKIKPEEANKLSTDMTNGVLKTRNGEVYKSVDSYNKIFIAAWRWWMRINRNKGIHTIRDVTCDLSTKPSEPSFVYITKEQLDSMLPYFHNKEYQLVCKFLFDTMVRFPKELINLKVKHVYEKDGEMCLVIPREISKASTIFDRDINLLYCGDALKEHIKEKGLEPEDYIFDISPEYFNFTLKKISVQVLGNGVSHPLAKGRFGEISGYDFRHSGAIHFRILSQKNPAFIGIDAIRQRGGWADFDKLNYYSRFIGLTGKIDKQGLLIHDDRHKIEKELDLLKAKDEAREKRDMIRERIDTIREEMDNVQNRLLLVATDSRLTPESKNQEMLRLMQVLAELKNQINSLKNKSQVYSERYVVFSDDKEGNRSIHPSPFAVRHQGAIA